MKKIPRIMSQWIGVIESCKNYYFISLEGSDCGSEMHTERFFKKIYFLQKDFKDLYSLAALSRQNALYSACDEEFLPFALLNSSPPQRWSPQEPKTSTRTPCRSRAGETGRGFYAKTFLKIILQSIYENFLYLSQLPPSRWRCRSARRTRPPSPHGYCCCCCCCCCCCRRSTSLPPGACSSSRTARCASSTSPSPPSGAASP